MAARTRAAHQGDPDRLRQAACGTLCLTRGASPDVGAGLPADYLQVAPRGPRLGTRRRVPEKPCILGFSSLPGSYLRAESRATGQPSSSSPATQGAC